METSFLKIHFTREQLHLFRATKSTYSSVQVYQEWNGISRGSNLPYQRDSSCGTKADDGCICATKKLVYNYI